MSVVSHVRDSDPERPRGRRRLAVRQVRAALGRKATGHSRGLYRVGRRSRARSQAGYKRRSRCGVVHRCVDQRTGRHTMTFATSRVDVAALPRTASSTTLAQSPSLVVPGSIRRVAEAVGDLLGAVAIVLGIPFVILAIGTPIALGVRLLLWIGGLL